MNLRCKLYVFRLNISIKSAQYIFMNNIEDNLFQVKLLPFANWLIVIIKPFLFFPGIQLYPTKKCKLCKIIINMLTFNIYIHNYLNEHYIQFRYESISWTKHFIDAFMLVRIPGMQDTTGRCKNFLFHYESGMKNEEKKFQPASEL